jgi:hypothetical protein
MHCYLVPVLAASITLREHLAGRWLAADELDEVDWAGADLAVARHVKEILTNSEIMNS